MRDEICPARDGQNFAPSRLCHNTRIYLFYWFNCNSCERHEMGLSEARHRIQCREGKALDMPKEALEFKTKQQWWNKISFLVFYFTTYIKQQEIPYLFMWKGIWRDTMPISLLLGGQGLFYFYTYDNGNNNRKRKYIFRIVIVFFRFLFLMYSLSEISLDSESKPSCNCMSHVFV